MDKHKILLIGESCVDKFIYGDCTRLNPEAPTPVFIPNGETINGGMASNVKENLKVLGSHPTFITNETECIKTRFVDEQSNYIILRVDNDIDYAPLIIEECSNIEYYDAVVISDYDKGLINPQLIEEIGKRSKLTFIDTKKKLGPWAHHVDYIKLNKQEYQLNKEIVDSELSDKTIITLGGGGCQLDNDVLNGDTVEVRDVVGAGDTFLAALVIDFLENEGKIYKAMEFANKCASDVVQHKGVVTPNLNKIHGKEKQ
jgi:D-beta-D-heptose 7-phosphate kinase/D-beta-D-heptose 1-phosphate adenosyltransferase